VRGGAFLLTMAAMLHSDSGFKLAFVVPKHYFQASPMAAPLVKAHLPIGTYGDQKSSAWRTSSTSRRVFGLGASELLVITAVAAVFFGPEALKGLAKEVGKSAGDLQDVPKAFEEGMAAAEASKEDSSRAASGDKVLTDRRGAVASSAGLAALMCLPRPASAEDAASLTETLDAGVSLPNGARQEDRIKRGLEAWRKLAKKVENGEVTDEDWTNTQGFLRRLYSLQDDMNYLARGLKAEKKAKAEEIVTSFKKEVKAADKPAKVKDTQKFLGYYTETQQQLVDFLELLVDATEDLDFGELEAVE